MFRASWFNIFTEDHFFGGGSVVEAFGMEMERLSSILVAIEDSSTIVLEAFFLNWSKYLCTLFSFVRSTVSEEEPVLEYMTHESYGLPALKF